MPRPAPFSHVACPLDGQPLVLVEGCLVCPSGHSFDLAKQGYCNLLPVQMKRSRAPGDNAEMVAARQRFLDAGHYRPIADTLVRLARSMVADVAATTVLDAGCGDGYYLDALAKVLPQAACIGLDVAKPAILAAARRNRTLTWLVGTNARPPVVSGSLDLVICLFGFPHYEAFARVLKPGGQVLLVDPGPAHLLELRERLYPEVRLRTPPALDGALAAGFHERAATSLRFSTGVLSPSDLQDLLTMTPHGHRAAQDRLAAVRALPGLGVTADVIFRHLQLSQGAQPKSEEQHE